MRRLLPQLVVRAAEILGGFDALAVHLGVEEHRVRFWANGRATAPDSVTFVLVDLILKDDVARARQDRRNTPRGTFGQDSPTGRRAD
jgi:hypothetical protein